MGNGVRWKSLAAVQKLQVGGAGDGLVGRTVGRCGIPAKGREKRFEQVFFRRGIGIEANDCPEIGSSDAQLPGLDPGVGPLLEQANGVELRVGGAENFREKQSNVELDVIFRG